MIIHIVTNESGCTQVPEWGGSSYHIVLVSCYPSFRRMSCIDMLGSRLTWTPRPLSSTTWMDIGIECRHCQQRSKVAVSKVTDGVVTCVWKKVTSTIVLWRCEQHVELVQTVAEWKSRKIVKNWCSTVQPIEFLGHVTSSHYHWLLTAAVDFHILFSRT